MLFGWATPYIERELAERFAPNSGGRRLLEISPDESFARNLLEEPLVSSFEWSQIDNKPVIIIGGNSRSKYGTPFSFGMVVRGPAYRQDQSLRIKVTDICRKFRDQPMKCEKISSL